MTYLFAPKGEFQLRQAKRFIEGFDPVDQPVTDEDPLHLAFLSDDWQPTFASLHQTDHRVLCDVIEGSSDGRDQVQRILSLDLDATAFDHLQDPVITVLREQRCGLRPVLFSTPFEAGCWSVLTQRNSMVHASKMRRELCRRAGHRFELGGREWWTFPPPAAIIGMPSLPGATSTQIDRLTAVARAALDGHLKPGLIRRTSGEEALERLQSIEGIGPFGSELIYVRGAGAADHFPRNEPRLHAHMSRLYDLGDPSAGQLAEIAERWAPFRTWASLLIRLDAESSTDADSSTNKER